MEEEDNLLHESLITSSTTRTLKNPAIITEAAISPMNSNFSALFCKDILSLIFEKLPITDLARASCVCRIWSLIASDREIQTASFKAPWKLKEIVGNPTSGSFWKDNSLSKFAISHRILRGDSVASLAVKYSVQVIFSSLIQNLKYISIILLLNWCCRRLNEKIV